MFFYCKWDLPDLYYSLTFPQTLGKDALNWWQNKARHFFLLIFLNSRMMPLWVKSVHWDAKRVPLKVQWNYIVKYIMGSDWVPIYLKPKTCETPVSIVQVPFDTQTDPQNGPAVFGSGWMFASIHNAQHMDTWWRSLLAPPGLRRAHLRAITRYIWRPFTLQRHFTNPCSGQPH